ncbi:MAG: FtsK/SpoIIIE domain-containing protein [Scytonema sp. PMC 1069.18]|nr:FtsK/SpoIIIE domain-containing protein [Scytonema sp. PMC 1069.18]MEC4884504.1 FtsK/SpoIIIE domain-containing protein [Scytonema sp. PMC 1070.18]
MDSFSVKIGKMQKITQNSKKTQFPKLGKNGPWLWRPNFQDVNTALSVLFFLENEMQQRYTVLERANVANLDSYNRVFTEAIPHVAIVLNDSSHLSGDKELKSLFESTCQRIGEMGKAVGIHLILGAI